MRSQIVWILILAVIEQVNNLSGPDCCRLQNADNNDIHLLCEAIEINQYKALRSVSGT